MKRAEKDFAVCMMDLYARSVNDRLPLTSRALKTALETMINELRERDDQAAISEARGAFYDANGDLLP